MRPPRLPPPAPLPSQLYPWPSPRSSSWAPRPSFSAFASGSGAVSTAPCASTSLPPAFSTAAIARLRGTVDLDGKRRAQGSPGQQPDPVQPLVDQPGRAQRLEVDRLGRIEPTTVDRRLQAIEIHRRKLLPKRILETALGQTPIDRHLAAFEGPGRAARPRALALVAPSRGLAGARSDTAADPLTRRASPPEPGQVR